MVQTFSAQGGGRGGRSARGSTGLLADCSDTAVDIMSVLLGVGVSSLAYYSACVVGIFLVALILFQLFTPRFPSDLGPVDARGVHTRDQGKTPADLIAALENISAGAYLSAPGKGARTSLAKHLSK